MNLSRIVKDAAGSARPALGPLVLIFLMFSPAWGQNAKPAAPSPQAEVQASGEAQGDAPLTLTLQDALERARANSPQFQAALTAVKMAQQNRVQARATMLPSVNYTQQYLNTQGNGVLPTGRFVTNDGIHVYRVWGVVNQTLDMNTFTQATYRQASAGVALARAQAEIAQRGLGVTVTQEYYALLVAQRAYATAQQGLGQARHFLKISQELEQGGEVAQSDVIKFQLQVNQQSQGVREASLAMETARLNLAVLLFPDFFQNFTAVDDLDAPQPLPELGEVRQMAGENNPDIRTALENLREKSLEVSVSRARFLPSLSLDFDYGIEANSLAFRSSTSAFPEAGRLPNLGYFLTATLSFPVWNWGSLRSKLHQAQYQKQQARVDLAFAQRQLLRNLFTFYNEAKTAKVELNTLRESADLAADSLRLNMLRYRAGEATVLELVDAQNTLTAARDAYDQGQARYRVALSQLQTVTGPF